MTRPAAQLRARQGWGAATSMAIVLALAGCSGSPTAGGTPGQVLPSASTGQDEPTQNPGPPAAGWTGTITIHGVIDQDETKDISSGDPGSTYHETGTSHDVTQTDVTDTFNITAQDPDDLSYGIDQVELAGSAANAGSTLERYVQNWNKQNSGCTWKEEVGTETKGSWTGSGKADGTLHFSDDGSYYIDVSADTTGPTGESADGPQLPYRIWDTFSDLAAGCTGNGYDTTTTQGPIVWWVSSFLGEADVNNIYSDIHGQLNPGNPGSTVDGSLTWKLNLPAMTMTITWHLVHDGPITLPHS